MYFRVSEFPRPLCGSAEGPQTPDSMFPSVQIPGYMNSTANSTFRVPSFRRPLLGPSRMDRPKSQNPNGKYSPDWQSQIPSFRVQYLRINLRREQILEYREQFLFPLLYSGTAHSLPRGLGQMGGTRVGGDGTWVECCFLTKVVLFFNIRIHVHSYACVCHEAVSLIHAYHTTAKDRRASTAHPACFSQNGGAIHARPQRRIPPSRMHEHLLEEVGWRLVLPSAHDQTSTNERMQSSARPP
jgi:hypothetical protein